MKRGVLAFFSAAALLCAVLVGAAASGGWDLTKPLDFYFPPPIADEPTRAESGELAVKNGSPSLEDQIMELTNQERWNNGQLPPLKRNSLLDNSAETHSTNMATRHFFAHCDLDTKATAWDRIGAAGYDFNWAGENIAGGNSTATETMDQWMGSSGHRANILSSDFRELGVGYVYNPADTANARTDNNGDCNEDGTWPYVIRHYWTQNFGTINIVYPVVINREAYETATRNVNLYLYGSGWASEMRIRNENGTWTAWQPFSTNVAWQLSAAAGTKEVFVEIRSGATVRGASDTIVSTVTADPNLVFEDGFESNNTNAWSDTVP